MSSTEDNRKQITVSFDSGWITQKTKAGIRVIRLLESAVRNDNRIRICSTSRTGLTLETDDSHRTDLLARLAEVLSAKAGEAKPWEHAAFSGDLAGLDVPRSIASPVLFPAPDDASEAVPEPPRRRPASSSSAPAKGAVVSNPTEKEGAPDPHAPVKAAESAEEMLRDLCGTAPLRYEPALSNYLREVATVVPRLQALGAMNHFWRRHLLVSIDDGWGFTAFRNSLCALYRALGLFGENARRDCRELEIRRRPGDAPDEDWRKAIDLARGLGDAVKKGSAPPLLCLDISAWQERLAEPAIKEYLRRINDAATGFVCVFRVTFMEPGVLRRVERELDDVLGIRVVAAPPASMESMVAFVREKLARSDFVVGPDADRAIEGWILREMSDGSFFGYKTLDKIASRIVYERVLSAPPDAVPAAVRTIDDATLRALSGAPGEEDDPDAALARLVGMDGVRKTLREIVAQLSARKELARKGRRVRAPAIHMAFSGAPGTGKTTMARVVAGMLKKAGLLRKGHLVEIRGRDLCGEYVGQTAPKTSAICRRAAGSVLFIDEAYSLWRGEGASDRDYGREALDTLVAEMENHRDDFCVILAGYSDEMSVMLGGNAGLGSRIPHRIEFPNYSREELGEIFLRMLGEGDFAPERGLEKAVRAFFARIPDETMQARDFGNARLVRNLYERVWGKAAYRRSLSGEPELRLLVADLDAAAADPEFKSLFVPSGAHRPLGFSPA